MCVCVCAEYDKVLNLCNWPPFIIFPSELLSNLAFSFRAPTIRATSTCDVEQGALRK